MLLRILIQQLRPIRLSGTEDKDSPGEPALAQLVLHRCGQALMAFVEIDGLCRHNDPQLVRRKNHWQTGGARATEPDALYVQAFARTTHGVADTQYRPGTLFTVKPALSVSTITCLFTSIGHFQFRQLRPPAKSKSNAVSTEKLHLNNN